MLQKQAHLKLIIINPMHKKLIIAPVGKFCGRTDLPINKFTNLNLIGSSAIFLQALKLIDRFSAYDATVLILGETVPEKNWRHVRFTT